MCNRIWWVCENFERLMEMIETNHLKKKFNKVVCKAKYIYF